MNTFKPYKGFAPQAITLNGTTQYVTLPQVSRSGDVIRVVVSGTETARVQPGTSTAATSAISNGALMLANSVETFSLDTDISHVAVSGATGSTVEIQLGVGF